MTFHFVLNVCIFCLVFLVDVLLLFSLLLLVIWVWLWCGFLRLRFGVIWVRWFGELICGWCLCGLVVLSLICFGIV